jgi:superoxide dismutase
MAFTLPDLPYPYDSLQPYLSKETLEYHHDKHHATYVTTANNLLKDRGLEGKSLEEIVKETYGKNVPLFNNAAQHYNHSEYWKSIKPNGGSKVPGSLEKRSLKLLDRLKRPSRNWCRLARHSSALAGPGLWSRMESSPSRRRGMPRIR